jgi:hypothetical protein
MLSALHSHLMRRRPSRALRAFRGLVVLVTVWCTGCSGFEPLIEAALGRSEMGMVCGSEEGATATGSQVSTGSAVERPMSAPGVSALPTSPAQSGFSCGCTSCKTVAPAMWSFALLPAPALPRADTAELPLVSIGRVPLLPPPERAVS